MNIGDEKLSKFMKLVEIYDHVTAVKDPWLTEDGDTIENLNEKAPIVKDYKTANIRDAIEKYPRLVELLRQAKYKEVKIVFFEPFKNFTSGSIPPEDENEIKLMWNAEELFLEKIIGPHISQKSHKITELENIRDGLGTLSQPKPFVFKVKFKEVKPLSWVSRVVTSIRALLSLTGSEEGSEEIFEYPYYVPAFGSLLEKKLKNHPDRFVPGFITQQLVKGMLQEKNFYIKFQNLGDPFKKIEVLEIEVTNDRTILDESRDNPFRLLVP